VADRLMGSRPSFEQYALEAHAGVAEVCLALLEQDADNSPDAEEALDPTEPRATAAAAGVATPARSP
jgi:hypothetical protein